jgi:hypothetical protein
MGCAVSARGMLEGRYLVLEPRSLYHIFVLTYIEIYVFRGSPLKAYSLQQSYHPTQPFKQEKYNRKSKI